jgi:phosphotriesterase-related protein
MSFVQTVSGKIKPEEMGVTYGHEHLLFCPPSLVNSEDPDMQLLQVDKAIQEVNYFKLAGGQCIVEMSTVEMGRSPEGMEAISKVTGIHIIAATGFNKGRFCDPYVADKSLDQIVAEMVHDLMQGMDATGIKAGLIKASSSKDHMTPGEEKIFQAAAKAHLETGAPVSTHTEAGTFALEQIQRLTGAGVKPEHIIIGHLDRKLEWDYLRTVAETGVFMGFDQLSKEKYFPDSERISMIKQLIEAGHRRQIMLSGDLARMSYWPSYGFGKGPGLTYILWRFVPWMLETGISKEAVDDILVKNPSRAFGWNV